MGNLNKIDTLFEGAELEPEFAKQLKSVFQTAVNEKVHTILEEAVKQPYAVGMSQAMKSTGDTPPLDKDTIALAHKIAKAIMQQEEISEQEDEVPAGESPDTAPSEDEIKSVVDQFYNSVEELSKDVDMRRIMKAADIEISEFVRTLKATVADLDGNKLAEPLVKLLGGLFNAIANDSTVSSRIAQSIDKEMAANEEMEDEKIKKMEADDLDDDMMESVINNIDTYFNYLAEQWIENNKLEVENGVKIQLAEEVLNNIKQFYTTHNVTNIPTVDLKGKLEKEVKITENKLNKQIEQNALLLKENKEYLKKEIVSSVTKDLTETQKEKFAKLSDVVIFESEEDYKNQLNILKENILSNKNLIKQDKNLKDSVVLTENNEKPNTMRKYVDTISRGVKWE